MKTKQKWAIGIESDDERTQVITEDGGHLCYVEQYPHEEYARLITAAPDLLEACMVALAFYGNDDNEITDQLRAAIRKAEGD